MKFMKSALLLLFTGVFGCDMAISQQPYTFQQDDSVLKQRYYDQALQKKKSLIASLDKEYAGDYKKIYEDRFKEVAAVLQSKRTVTASPAHDYLQRVAQKIIAANPELQGLETRVVFSRDWWPNAYSMGEGTIVFNAGLLVFLDNEAQLAFILSHEFSHYYLDHGNKAIKKNVETVNSKEFKDEVKRIKKEQYMVNQQVNALLKPIVFDGRKHSRDNETEADRTAFRFMQRAGYDCNAAKTTLELLDKVDDSSLFRPLVLPDVFQSAEYPFKRKWIQKQSAIFSEMGDDDTPLTKKEKDSLKTHPDCSKRIALLSDSLQKARPGQRFLVDENVFRQLKKDFILEITEQNYREKHLSRNLYYSLLLMQNKETEPMAIYSVARCLNSLYEAQRDHTFGTMVNTEDKAYPEDYNLLLRMLSRIKLDELAALNDYFCRQYQAKANGYPGFAAEMNKAKQFNHQ